MAFLTFMVRDLQKSVQFYRDVAGLHIVRQFNAGPGEIVFMANAENETMVELIDFPNAPKIETKNMVMCFTAEEPLEELKTRIESMGYSTTDILNAPPQPRNFKVADPDGVTIEISE